MRSGHWAPITPKLKVLRSVSLMFSQVKSVPVPAPCSAELCQMMIQSAADAGADLESARYTPELTQCVDRENCTLIVVNNHRKVLGELEVHSWLTLKSRSTGEDRAIQTNSVDSEKSRGSRPHYYGIRDPPSAPVEERQRQQGKVLRIPENAGARYRLRSSSKRNR